jgi:hypothetical protein
MQGLLDTLILSTFSLAQTQSVNVKMDIRPYDVAGLDPNNFNFNFGIVSPGAVCQSNTPRRGQAVLRITF